MLYHLFYWLLEGKQYAYHSPLFRATMAVILGFVIVWAFAPRVIRTLVRLRVGDQPEFDHEVLNKLAQTKKNTPTMGDLVRFNIFKSISKLNKEYFEADYKYYKDNPKFPLEASDTDRKQAKQTASNMINEFMKVRFP